MIFPTDTEYWVKFRCVFIDKARKHSQAGDYKSQLFHPSWRRLVVSSWQIRFGEIRKPQALPRAPYVAAGLISELSITPRWGHGQSLVPLWCFGERRWSQEAAGRAALQLRA